MNKKIKAFLQASFSVSRFMLYLYGWAALSLLSLNVNIMFANIIFYSGLIFGTLWIFEKQFNKKDVKDE